MADLFTNEATIRKPPSLAYKTVTNFLEQFQDAPIPSHIDRSVMPTSMSGGNQAYLQSALKFLGLISENNVPEENFHRLMQAKDKHEKVAVRREVLINAYSFLLKDVEIERATTRVVVEKFKEQNLSGDTIRKAITFFLNAARDAELKVSPHIKPVQQPATRTRTTKHQKGDSKIDENLDDVPNNNKDEEKVERKNSATVAETPYEVLIKILDANMQDEEQDAVWTLIRYLKKKDAESNE